MISLNPATEEVQEIKEIPIEEIPKMVEKAKKAQKSWAEKPLEERVSVLKEFSTLMEKNKQSLATTMSKDMGKPLKKSISEVESVIEEVNYFSDKSLEWLAPEKAVGGYVEFDPLGVVGVISPWNFPLFCSLNGIIPALLAGNSVIHKPSGQSMLIGIEMGSLLEKIIPGVFQTLVGGKEHGKTLVKQDIQMITFTGSTAAGKHIMKSSSEKLHRLLLELGGLDAAIVLKDTNIKKAAKEIVKQNYRNTGQVCCAIKRVYVEKEIFDDFVQAAVEESKKVSFGPPLESKDMGPLVAKFQLDKVISILEEAKRKGAKVLTGGKKPSGKGFYFPHTVLTNVTHEMRVLKEEPFGPLLPIFPVNSWDEAVSLANDTLYGLTASVWTQNLKLAKKIASKLEVGVVGINTHGSGPAGAPWGGAKESGIGRMETKEGMREFTNIKYIQTG